MDNNKAYYHDSTVFAFGITTVATITFVCVLIYLVEWHETHEKRKKKSIYAVW